MLIFYPAVKFSLSEKATKNWKNLPLVLTLLSKTAVLSKQVGDFFQFCGFLRIYELYSVASKQVGDFSTFWCPSQKSWTLLFSSPTDHHHVVAPLCSIHDFKSPRNCCDCGYSCNLSLQFVIDRLLSILHLVRVWRKLTRVFQKLSMSCFASSICKMQEECAPATASIECGQHCTKVVAKWISFLRSQQNTLLNDCTTKMSLGLFDRTWWRISSYHIAYRGG